MQLLIKQAELYTPEAQGKQDILLAGGQIVAIAPVITPAQGTDTELIDGTKLKAVPGFIDAHVHIAGAGGEGGPQSRTPELPLSRLIEGGVTTVIGCLGTDGLTRSQESVLMKVKSLRHEGISSWMYAGAYQVPTPTLTGDIGRDIALIDEVIGAGEIALSDHRSSTPTVHELIQLASHARVGGMLGGKAGIVNIHMGDAKKPFQLLWDAVEQSELPLKQFFPTHINRNHYIFEDAKSYGKQGWLDLTTSSYPVYPDLEVKPSKAIPELLRAGVPAEHITMTSDANGSLPDFDEDGNLRKLEIGLPNANHKELADAVQQEGLDLSTALKTITSNVAHILKLQQKGRLAAGLDADIVLLDKDLQIHTVVARGRVMWHNYSLKAKGTYE